MQPQPGFVGHIRDVLAHLYDYPYLQRHPLADELRPADHLSPQESMLSLRATILEAIEEMNPGPDVPLRSLRGRAYNVLDLYYVEGLTIGEVARDLAVSDRQVYRELRRAEGMLATLLWPRRQSAIGADQDLANGSSRVGLILQEADRLRSEEAEMEAQALLDGAMAAVRRLAKRHAVRLEVTGVSGVGLVVTDRQIARQALVAMLSHAVKSAQPHTTVTLLVEPYGNGVRVRISFQLQDRTSSNGPFPAIARAFITQLGGQCSGEVDQRGRARLVFTLGTRPGATVLVIDDHEGLQQLFRRYLAGEAYQLIAASDGREGLRLAKENTPDVVVLDVMMPQQDGWEILQGLQSQENTRNIPTIVCSVLDDPELAYSLGAVAYLAKPVSRSQLLAALARCCRNSCTDLRPISPADTGPPPSLRTPSDESRR